MKHMTIKIDRELHKALRKILGRGELKYRYPSVASFANEAILKKLESLKQKNRLELKW
jgi:hypothetical protein